MTKTSSRSLVLTVSYSITLLAIVYGIVVTGRWMLADLSVREIRTELNSWSIENPPILNSWQNMHDELQRAITFKSNNAESYELLGYLYEWQERLTNDISSRNDAIAAYRQAIEFRPGWPDDWVNLARLKAVSGELDAEYAHALNRALVIGMNEPRVEVELLYAISLGWASLDLAGETAELLDAFINKVLLTGGSYPQKLEHLTNAGLLNAYCVQLTMQQNLASAPGAVRNRCKSLGVQVAE